MSGKHKNERAKKRTEAIFPLYSRRFDHRFQSEKLRQNWRAVPRRL